MLALGLSFLLCLWVPSASAAADFRVTDVRIVGPAGFRPIGPAEVELELIPLNEPVRILAAVKNVGTSDHTGPLTVNFVVQSADLAHEKRETSGLTDGLKAGKTKDAALSWTAPKLGNYTTTADVGGQTATLFQARFRVTETAVPAGELPVRILDYWWFFGAFVGTVALFGAVHRLR